MITIVMGIVIKISCVNYFNGYGILDNGSIANLDSWVDNYP